VNRRTIAALVAGAAMGAGAVGTALSQRIADKVPAVARPLPLSAVRLTGGPLKTAQDLNAKYLLELQPDRMLAFYRDRAGLPKKAEPYGGWDGDGRNLTGHIGGHYLSAVSLMYAATGDPRFKERADYIVNEMKVVQEAHGDGYLGAIKGGKEMFQEVAKGTIKSGGFDLNGQWAPWYTLHKTYAGLRDAYRHAGNATALEVEKKFAAWAESIVSKLDESQMQKMLDTEFGGMPEIFADLFADTGDKRWLDLSYRFDHARILEPFKQGEDKLAGVHGNTTVPKFIATASRYSYSGNADDKKAADFFWDRVVNHHTFATGGHGKDEYWREPDKLGRIVDGRTSESCNVYNMLKLTRTLFAQTPRVEHAEFHERALFNHVLGSMDPNDGSTCYMVPVGRSQRGKEYGQMLPNERNPGGSFTCCVGSGMESHALHGAGLYYESGDRFWVNIYAPSTATWESAGVNLEAVTDFPEGESATYTVTAKSPKAFTLALRRPAWAGEGFAVKVNGTAVKNLTRPASYIEITRTWKTGDAVSVTLPKALHLQPTPDMPRRAALMWGPLVLAGDLGPLPARAPGRRGGPGGAADQPRPEPPRIETPLLVAAERPISEWLKPVEGKPGVFKTQGVGRNTDVEFVPFYRLHRRTYTAYFDYFTPTEYEKHKAEIAAERERQRKLEEASVAYVQPGEMQPERDYNQQGENTNPAGRIDGRAGRQGTGWFSYDLPVDPDRPMSLVVTYHRDSRRARSFEILVDGQKLADVKLEANSEPRFEDVEYQIPSELLKGMEKVTVRFQAVEGQIGPVYGVRMIRADAPR
jgi:hypothetical protein